MKYTSQDLAKDLLEKIEENCGIEEISRWAHNIYIDRGRDLESDLIQTIVRLIVMEEGPEFELTIGELKELIEKLMSSSEN